MTNAGTNAADSPAAEPIERFERKFFVLPKNIGFAYALLRHVCRPDSEYSEGQVNSLYFDTPELDEHTRSASGEFKKSKIRIRWYGELGDYPEKASVFLELKSRRGFASSKQRRRLSVSADCLDFSHLSSGIVSKKVLLDTLTGFGHYPERPLNPVILISYNRYRFTEMLTGVRVSLDHRVRSSMVTLGVGHGERGLRMPGGVIEVKGPSLELPATLRHIGLLDVDWSRFSKYGNCIDAHMSDPGTSGRLWPPGRIPGP